LELHQVRYFLALSRTLNFTRAAETCNVTQPALTRAIQRLEDELGGPLLYRERSLTQLTELGRALVPHLQATLSAAEAAKQLAGNLRQRTAVLRVGLTEGLSAALVTASLAELARRFPALELQVRHAEQKPLVDSLLLGETDAALLIDDGDLPERLHRWHLLYEGCRVAFLPGHRFEWQESIELSALDGETMVHGQGWGDALAGMGWPREGMVRHSCATWEHVQHMVLAGLGVALLPCHVNLLAGLLARKVADAGDLRAIVLAAVNGRRYSPALDGFLKLNRAREFAAPAPGTRIPPAQAAAASASAGATSQ
jgi:DNA-binding transcriptional LysR family regulator